MTGSKGQEAQAWIPQAERALASATVKIMDSRAIFRIHLGFDIWTILYALLRSLLASMSSELARKIDLSSNTWMVS